MVMKQSNTRHKVKFSIYRIRSQLYCDDELVLALRINSVYIAIMKYIWASILLLLLVGGGFAFSSYLRLAHEEQLVATAQLRNRDRKEHLRTLVSAIKQYMSDHNKQAPGILDSTQKNICRTDVKVDCTDLVDLSKLTEEYLVTLPIDPLVSSGASTGYAIQIDGNIITVKAIYAEDEDVSISF